MGTKFTDTALTPALTTKFAAEDASANKGHNTGTELKALFRVGTTTNDNAIAGSIGEFIESEILTASAVGLTTGAPGNVTTISLTAGDWDVWGTVAFKPNGATTISALAGWVSATSASFPTIPNKGAETFFNLTFTTGSGSIFPIGVRRFSLASTTTIYLTAVASFGVNVMEVYGYIGARRVR